MSKTKDNVATVIGNAIDNGGSLATWRATDTATRSAVNYVAWNIIVSATRNVTWFTVHRALNDV